MGLLAPQLEYANRLKLHLQAFANSERAHIRTGNAKLATLIAGIVLAWISLKDHSVSAYWLILPAVVYVGLALLHHVVIRARTLEERAEAFYRAGIARIEDSWAGKGNSGERFRNTQHVYADDLDLFGPGSLFELLSGAQTPMGENRLAQWLLTPSPVAEIVERQKVVSELREKLDLRELLAMTGADLAARLDPESFVTWAESTPELRKPIRWAAAIVLTLGSITTLIYFFQTSMLWPLAVVLTLQLILRGVLQERALRVIHGLKANAEGLILFSEILKRFEQEQFTSPRLVELPALLRSGKRPASRAIRRLAQLVYWMDAQHGIFARTMDVPLLYTLHVAFLAEGWRKHWGRQVRAWVDAVAEMEALLSLAGYAYEHPDNVFPEFTASGNSTPCFDGTALGHPLIASSVCVRNDVLLDSRTRVLLVSGSNMSGKSTLLRTVGLSAVMAMAGAPVRAKSLRMKPLAVGTSIRLADSLQEGRSSFYTEILRIREVLELMKAENTLLFLFDELLEGTNSSDRRTGAEGLIRALIDRGAIGIVTTHDLALTEITEPLGNVVRNVHLQDYVEDGKMRFDYKLRDGIVAKSNALELMRLIGLDV